MLIERAVDGIIAIDSPLQRHPPLPTVTISPAPTGTSELQASSSITVGFDDIQSAAFQNPALTTVRQPLRTMGTLAAQTILSQIGSAAEHSRSRQLTVDPELVVRDSTCPPSRHEHGI